jgi:cysteine desulfurase
MRHRRRRVTRHYLDHASTSSLRPAAAAAMRSWLDGPAGGDPGRIHEEGMAARAAVEQARDTVAGFFGCRSSREVVFTSGATEAINAAAWGGGHRGSHQVVTAVEHSAVRAAAERAGAVTVVSVDPVGRVDPAEVLAAIQPDTGMVHVQAANHEVGTTQPVAEVVAGCRERGVLVHIDAASAAGPQPVAFAAADADLVSISGHKLGASPGTGALLVRRGVRIDPLLVGGDQERARRAGLENLPGIAGLAAAVAAIDVTREAAHARRLTARVQAGVAALDGVVTYGDPIERVPHIVCLGFAGVEPQAVLLGLDRAGIAVHSGSACSSEALEPSPVLAAMGVDALRSLRVSVGWNTVDADVDAFVAALPEVLGRLRSLSG